MPPSKPSPLKSKISLKSELCPQIYAHFFWDFELRTEMRDLKCWWLWSLNTFDFNLGWCCCLLNFKYIDNHSICIWRWSLYLLASCCCIFQTVSTTASFTRPVVSSGVGTDVTTAPVWTTVPSRVQISRVIQVSVTHL